MERSVWFTWLVAIISIQRICEGHWDASYFFKSTDGFTLKTNWMSFIRDDVRLSEMALPGTHDSGAFKELGSYSNGTFIDSVAQSIKNTIDRSFQLMVQTQCMNFEEQLNYGIRVFDIRVRHFEDSFPIHHGPFYLYVNFEDFLQAVQLFLTKNPSETVLFRLKNEHEEKNNTRTKAETLASYLPRYSTYLRTYDKNIKLSEARGKFIILADDRHFRSFGLDYCSQDIQDYCSIGMVQYLYVKWEKIKPHLLKAANGNSSSFYSNYLSAFAVDAPPYFVASGHVKPDTNAKRYFDAFNTIMSQTTGNITAPDFPRFCGIILGRIVCDVFTEGMNTLTRYEIPNIKGTRTVGIIMADFPGESLIQVIIQNNRNLEKNVTHIELSCPLVNNKCVDPGPIEDL